MSIVMLAYDRVRLLDVTGPLEVFGTAAKLGGSYEVTLCSPNGPDVADLERAESGWPPARPSPSGAAPTLVVARLARPARRSLSPGCSTRWPPWPATRAGSPRCAPARSSLAEAGTARRAAGDDPLAAHDARSGQALPARRRSSRTRSTSATARCSPRPVSPPGSIWRSRWSRRTGSRPGPRGGQGHGRLPAAPRRPVPVLGGGPHAAAPPRPAARPPRRGGRRPGGRPFAPTMASRAGFSARHLTRLFRQQVGITPSAPRGVGTAGGRAGAPEARGRR